MSEKSSTNLSLMIFFTIFVLGSRLCEAVDFEKQMFNLKQNIKWKTKAQI